MTYKLIDAQEIKKALAWLSKYWGKLGAPEYYPARTVDEAVSLLARYGKGANIVAGGIDIMGLMKNRVLSPGVLINIKTIPNLKYIVESPKGVTIGALTLINDIERSALIKCKYPILFEAAHSIASPQVRNMATMGGNLCQDVRCWYYRRPPDTGITFNCRRKIRDGICYALNGENQYHAVIDGNQCFAVCPSDMATALLALDASINTASTSGGRSISISELYSPLGITLEPDEVITSVQVPDVGSEVRQRFLKFRVRKAIDFAIVSVATIIKTQDGIVRNATIVIGGVAPAPYRAIISEQILSGRLITKSLAEKAAKASLSGAMPLTKNGYKIQIVEALVKRALLE